MTFAREDLAASEEPSPDSSLAPRHRCMLAQQAAEKALKAELIFLDIDPPRVHNLELLADLLPHDSAVRSLPADLGRLSLWLVESRYPGEWPDAAPRDAEVATADARQVVAAVEDDLARRGA